jgi:hypothetical protein
VPGWVWAIPPGTFADRGNTLPPHVAAIASLKKPGRIACRSSGKGSGKALDNFGSEKLQQPLKFVGVCKWDHDLSSSLAVCLDNHLCAKRSS